MATRHDNDKKIKFSVEQINGKFISYLSFWLCRKRTSKWWNGRAFTLTYVEMLGGNLDGIIKKKWFNIKQCRKLRKCLIRLLWNINEKSICQIA